VNFLIFFFQLLLLQRFAS
jgi:hypothetical protein